jgi:predicted HAD superfamily Cof-like phosphohydrolase
MSKSIHQQRVEELMFKAGQEVPNKPTVPNAQTRILRAKLILEEALETIRDLGVNVVLPATNNGFLNYSDLQFGDNGVPNLEGIADGCADISVVTMGTLSACGIHDNELLEEVDNNNLAKFGPGGYRRDDGKWVKPPNHKPPRIKEILESQQ